MGRGMAHLVALPITVTIPCSCGTSHSIHCDLLFHCKSLLKQCDYSVIQSVLVTKFWTNFMSSRVWNFCRWVVDIPPHEMPPSGNERGERSVFAGWVIEQLNMSLWFYFCCCLLSGFLIRVFKKVLSWWQKLWIRKRQKKLASVSKGLQGHVPQKIFKI